MPITPPKPWTDQDDQFLRVQFEMLTRADISKRLGRHPISIARRAVRLGLLKPKPKKKTKPTPAADVANNDPLDSELDMFDRAFATLKDLDGAAIRRFLLYLADRKGIQVLLHYPLPQSNIQAGNLPSR